MSEDVQWVQVRPGLSWHVFRTFTRMVDGARAVCGQPGVTASSLRDDRPGNEKTCERCLRIAGPR